MFFSFCCWVFLKFLQSFSTTKYASIAYLNLNIVEYLIRISTKISITLLWLLVSIYWLYFRLSSFSLFHQVFLTCMSSFEFSSKSFTIEFSFALHFWIFKNSSSSKSERDLSLSLLEIILARLSVLFSLNSMRYSYSSLDLFLSLF